MTTKYRNGEYHRILLKADRNTGEIKETLIPSKGYPADDPKISPDGKKIMIEQGPHLYDPDIIVYSIDDLLSANSPEDFRALKPLYSSSRNPPGWHTTILSFNGIWLENNRIAYLEYSQKHETTLKQVNEGNIHNSKKEITECPGLRECENGYIMFRDLDKEEELKISTAKLGIRGCPQAMSNIENEKFLLISEERDISLRKLLTGHLGVNITSYLYEIDHDMNIKEI